MSRYINADIAIDSFYEMASDTDHLCTVSDYVKVLESMSVEVVTCEDCAFLEVLNSKYYYARCKWHGRLFPSFGNPDTRHYFCADCQRREERGEMTMPRCIYADQLIAAVYDAYDDILEIHDRGAVISEKFRRLIDAQKTIDAIPVVRCKDCAYKQYYFTNDMVKCGCGNGAHHENFFCSDGERKEE